MDGNKPEDRLLELDALRGIAAMTVVMFHLTMVNEVGKFVPWYRGIGVTGVDLFFIISGFVIFLTLNKTKTAKDFIVSRFSRLYPVYWICVTITTLLVLFNEYFFSSPTNDILGKYLANLTMFQHYVGFGDIDPPYWTLRVEMLFYIMMLILFISNKLKNIVAIGCALLIFLLFYNSKLVVSFPEMYDFFNKYVSLVNHFPLFFAGILFYIIKFEKPLLIYYVLIAACLFVQILLFDDGGKAVFFLTRSCYSFMITAYLFLFILYVNKKLSFIVSKYTLYLGSISYSLYLIHSYFCTNFLVPLLINEFHVNFYIASFAIALPLLIILSHAITHGIEKPAMRFIRNRYKTQSLTLKE